MASNELVFEDESGNQVLFSDSDEEWVFEEDSDDDSSPSPSPAASPASSPLSSPGRPKYGKLGLNSALPGRSSSQPSKLKAGMTRFSSSLSEEDVAVTSTPKSSNWAGEELIDLPDPSGVSTPPRAGRTLTPPTDPAPPPPEDSSIVDQITALRIIASSGKDVKYLSLRPKNKEIAIPAEPAAAQPNRNDPRANVVAELITTEETYVNDLDILINYYIVPCRTRKSKKRAGKPLLSPEHIGKLFSNVEAIANLNQVLLKELQKTVALPPGEQRIGACFLLLSKCLLIYTDYCSNQPAADELFLKLKSTNEEFAALEQENLAKPECRRLGLNAFLIKPVQRVCKYPLLLKELLKHTPQSHPDFADLTEACEAMQIGCVKLNERKREIENMSHFLTIKARTGKNFIETGRRFIEDGTTGVLTEKKNKRTKKLKQRPRSGRFVLFSDMIVFIVEGKVIAQIPFHCSAVSEINIPKFPMAFALVSRANRLIFLPNDEAQRQHLWSLMNERITELHQKEKQANAAISRNLGQRAKPVSRGGPTLNLDVYCGEVKHLVRVPMDCKTVDGFKAVVGKAFSVPPNAFNVSFATDTGVLAITTDIELQQYLPFTKQAHVNLL